MEAHRHARDTHSAEALGGTEWRATLGDSGTGRSRLPPDAASLSEPRRGTFLTLQIISARMDMLKLDQHTWETTGHQVK